MSMCRAPANLTSPLLLLLLSWLFFLCHQIRESGVPAVVVRPCALTEEPAGAPLELDQGDVIKVREPAPAMGWGL